VSSKERFCWQHASGFKRKWRSLTRNQTAAFLIGIASVIGVIITVLAWLRPDFWSSSPPKPPGEHADSRPYVTVKRMDLLGEFADGKSVQGQVTLVNSGRVPATEMIACATVVFRPNSQPMTDDAVCPETDIPGPPPKGEFSHVVLGPDIPVTIKTQNFSLSPATQALSLIEAGGAKLYVYGDASYADTVRPEVRHHLTFCGSYNSISKAFDTCAKHNHLD
jgi:hypothetical protein